MVIYLNEYTEDFLDKDLIKEINNIKEKDRYKNNNKYTVYIHIVPQNLSNYNYDKYYVGVTCQKPEARWGKNGVNHKNIHFYDAINKYGWDNIIHLIIVSEICEDSAFYLEKQLIKCLMSDKREYGYNISSGGEGGNRKQLKPVKQYDLLGNFIREYASAAEAARYLNTDRTYITRACKHDYKACGYLWCYSEDEINYPYKRKDQRYLVQFDLNDKFLKLYNCIKDASEITKIGNDSISKCTNGHHKTAGGYKWRFLDELKESEILDSFLLERYLKLIKYKKR